MPYVCLPLAFDAGQTGGLTPIQLTLRGVGAAAETEGPKVTEKPPAPWGPRKPARTRPGRPFGGPRSGFLRHAFATNTVLMTVGFALTGYQIAGYYLGS